MFQHRETTAAKRHLIHIQPCNSPVLLIKGISYPFSVFSLDKSNSPPEKSMETATSYFTVCANMSANELVCVLLSFYFWRGEKTQQS